MKFEICTFDIPLQLKCFVSIRVFLCICRVSVSTSSAVQLHVPRYSIEWTSLYFRFDTHIYVCIHSQLVIYDHSALFKLTKSRQALSVSCLCDMINYKLKDICILVKTNLIRFLIIC